MERAHPPRFSNRHIRDNVTMQHFQLSLQEMLLGHTKRIYGFLLCLCCCSADNWVQEPSAKSASV